MAPDFSINMNTFPNDIASTAAKGQAAVKGTFMGQNTVVLEDPMSLISIAAEELTFSVDTTDDFELIERKEKEKGRHTEKEQMRLYINTLQQSGKTNVLQQCKESLKTAASKEEVLRRVRQFFSDPSDTYAALTYAEEALEQEGAGKSDSWQLIRSVQEELLQTDGPAIHAGIQGTIAAQNHKDIGTTEVLRDSYRNVALDLTSPEEVFDHILTKFGNAHFEQALEFLFQALGSDLAADKSSMGTTHLEHVNANLGAVRLMQSAYRICEALMQRWHQVHNIPTCDLTSQNLLGQVLALRKETYLSPLQIEQIAKQASAPDIGREVLFLQEMMQAARSFPPQLFGDYAGRMKVLDAVQGALDKAIEREDAYYAAQGAGS